MVTGCRPASKAATMGYDTMMMGYTTTAMDTTTRPDDAMMWYDTNGRGYDPAKEGTIQRRRV